MKDCRVFAPATVSNIGPGFDLMGFAIDNPGDILRVRKNNLKKLVIINETSCPLPQDPEKNVSTVAIQALLDEEKTNQGFDIIFEEKIRPGSGIGSSAASCTSAVYAVNQLLGRPYSNEQLIDFALKGEFIASCSLHADNIAPALLGGVILIRSYHPLEIIELKAPDCLWCSVVHPEIEVKTSESRKLIPLQISLEDTLQQCGNIASLVAGITTSDFLMIKNSLTDRIAEPQRKNSIPGYDDLKEKLTKNDLSGMNISGSGPSVFALSENQENAEWCCQVMQSHFESLGINNKTYFSKISQSGTRQIG